MKIPSYMSFEAAASLGSGLGTIGLALFESLKVPETPKRPSEKQVDVLVYGTSTATGTLAIQLLNCEQPSILPYSAYLASRYPDQWANQGTSFFGQRSGLNVIATCSPHNFDLVRSNGANAVFRYKLP